MKNRRKFITGILLSFILCITLSGCDGKKNEDTTVIENQVADIPEYSGTPFASLNHNEPEFDEKEIIEKSFERYSNLDYLGRCGMAVACVGKDTMPKEKRDSIGKVKPTGWHTIKYDFIDGKYLYNRCHLIGYQLTGENANEKNLITGTRYMNVEGMLPFENMVADYIKETGNHVMYRVTPIYEGNNLLVDGVQMEGYSVEDKGKSISFNVFCYNVQPKIEINYATGESKIEKNYTESKTENGSLMTDSESSENKSEMFIDYVLNMNTYKFHLPSCMAVKQINNENKGTYTGSRQDLIEQGYEPCKICNP